MIQFVIHLQKIVQSKEAVKKKKNMEFSILGWLAGVLRVIFHRGAPKLCYPVSYFVCDLKPHAKFRNPMITHLGEK